MPPDQAAGPLRTMIDHRAPDPDDRRLDLRGLHCPMPVLRARKALRQVGIGAVVVLECTDPLTTIDIPHFVAEAGHEIVDWRRDDDLYIYRIRRRR